jgi:hypothetical protein
VLRLGICTLEQYDRVIRSQDLSASGVSYGLLDIPDDAPEGDVQRFEAISLRLRTSNGTTRLTFPHRFWEVDKATSRILKEFYDINSELRIQDRAMSHGLTSYEWAQELFQTFPRAHLQASDRILYLYRISLSSGETFILEPDGSPLQYVRPPFVVSIGHREPFRFPFNHLIAIYAKRRFRRLALRTDWRNSQGGDEYKLDQICCIHPRARSLSKVNPQFRFCALSVFERTPGIDVLRTMNILNQAYFPPEQLIEGANAAFHSLKLGGIWIVGRTLEEDATNHVTFLRRKEKGWEILERIGCGSEMEQFAAHAPALAHGPHQ